MAPRQRNVHREKEQRKSKHLTKVLQGIEATQITGFKRRLPTLLKKAQELQKLCGVSVSIVCFGRDGKVHMFPKNEIELRDLVEKSQGLQEKDKNEINLICYLEEQRRKHVDKKLDEKFLELSKWLTGLSEADALSFLDLKLMRFKDKLKFWTSQQKIHSASTSGTNDVGLLGLEKQNWVCDYNMIPQINYNISSNNVVSNFGGELGSVVRFLPDPNNNNTIDYVVSDHNSATSQQEVSDDKANDIYTANSSYRVPQELGHGLQGFEENFGIYNYEGLKVLLGNLDPISYHEAVAMLAP